ncbi:MAG: RsmE family RNA methyltransferase [Oscillospiraceae bacterium]
MPRFFVNVEDENNIIIEGDDARHIGRSLRMKLGDAIMVTCKGTDYNCTIKSISDEVVTLNLIDKHICKSEPSVKLILFQAIPKGDKFETILQKSIELGASEIVPVLTRRCVSRPTEKDFSKKLKRYEKISESASKQSGRGIIPKVHNMVTLDKAIDMMKSNDLNYILYENGEERFSAERLKDVKTIGVFIGSEGGFDLEEVEKVKSNGGVPIWLGERILRCETAPLSAITIIMHLTGNM